MPYPAAVPARVDLAKLGEPIYRGSVQRLYAVPDDPAFMVCETTAAGSVFDVGSIFEIAGNDLNRASFRHAIYSRMADPESWRRVRAAVEQDGRLPERWRRELLTGLLEMMIERGAMTHHVGMVDAVTGDIATGALPGNPSRMNLVRRFPVIKPTPRELLGHHVYDYAQFQQSDSYVIPLEYIVRFGMTSGSSVLAKYQSLTEVGRRAFELEMGIDEPPQAWRMLSRPVFDFTSKHEPEDRAVTKQEALLMSGVSAQFFLDTIKMAVLGGWAVREMLGVAGLELWDLKWEFAVDRDDLFFVDTIDPDSFRATSTVEVEGLRLVLHYNKQAMRDYYRLAHADWHAGLNVAKQEARQSGAPFKEVLAAGQAQGRFPATPEVDPEFLAIQADKARLLTQLVLDANGADNVRAELAAAGRAEVEFYQQRGLLPALLALNAIGPVQGSD